MHTKEPWWAKENFKTCWYCSSRIGAGHNISGIAHYCAKNLSTYDGEEGGCAGYSPDEKSITFYKTKSRDAERAHAKEVQQQRDELLAALKYSVEIAENKRSGNWDDVMVYRALIAKCEA